MHAAASTFHQWHDYGAPPINDSFIAVLEFAPLAVLVGLVAVAGRRRSIWNLACLTVASALPSLAATLLMLYDVCFPRADGDIFGGLIIFVWIGRSALGLLVGLGGLVLVASLTRPRSSAAHDEPPISTGLR